MSHRTTLSANSERVGDLVIGTVLLLMSCIGSFSCAGPKNSVSSGRPTMMSHFKYEFVDVSRWAWKAPPTGREIWTAGTEYLRAQIASLAVPDESAVLINHRLDTWAYNSKSKTGKHRRISESEFAGISSAYLGAPEPSDLLNLKTGSENEFFESRHAARLADQSVDSCECAVYRLVISQTELMLYRRLDNQHPLQISITSPSNRFSIRLSEYEPSCPFDSTLFTPPSDIKFSEFSGTSM